MEEIGLDIRSEIKLVVDYAKPLEQFIADGKYDFVGDLITDKNFPAPPKLVGQKLELLAKLFHFDNHISSEDIIFEMNKAGYRPANLLELLVVGFLYPDLQRQFSIYALGSIVLTNGNLTEFGDYRPQACHYRFVPCLFLDMFSKRRLCVGSFDNSSSAKSLYLGILK